MNQKQHGLRVHCGNGTRRYPFYRGDFGHLVRDTKSWNRLAIIFDWLVEQHQMEFCSKYGEPGYSDPEEGICFANWNNVPKAFVEVLEANGYEIEWSDEWAIDYNNDKAYRTSPNSYGWEPSAIYTGDGELLTPDDSASEIIEERALTYHQYGKTKPSHFGCVPSWITQEDLEAEGYERHPDPTEPDFESGWFPGQNDDPATIAQTLFCKGNVESVVFRKTEQSQFYCKFECWVRYDEPAVD